ncbi:hydrogenase expression/formation protein HypE [Endomicrobium proavitum]|uniref:Carbamoyl phosphate phosphatase, hydrogenase 3 maturation protein n=1 Tax=Endomicrobium proavitum TaxID=1408281 RepID=A0A0G3WH80_9BACT|nr:hydrogenase expression/formation protein HypE [Endomicrobium proavitum]AKL97688.1 carbamoyl phosphate phosphatase, hydrogenase 3 maturation protein [Endomicrobium proavitum]
MDKITLAHGAGGNASKNLINKIFKKYFSNKTLDALDDAAVLKISGLKAAFSTDSFVINPIFFNGGDIGKLSVCGTINDISMMGATPAAMSAAAIIEEGFPLKDLERIAKSMSVAAKNAGVEIVTGDTKVVKKGEADGIFINTSAIGVIKNGVNLSGKNAKSGDKIIVSGNIAEHGISIMLSRDNFGFKNNIKSDCACLNGLTGGILKVCPNVHVLRDPTRGGVAATLNEIAESSNVGIIIDAKSVPVAKEVAAICRVLGFDPLYIANEGKLLSIQSAADTVKVLNACQKNKLGKNAKVIAEVVNSPKGVWVKTASGALRKVLNSDMEQLPRIC